MTAMSDDIKKIKEAYNAGGIDSATKVFNAIVAERKLVRWETILLRDKVLRVLELN